MARSRSKQKSDLVLFLSTSESQVKFNRIFLSQFFEFREFVYDNWGSDASTELVDRRSVLFLNELVTTDCGLKGSGFFTISYSFLGNVSDNKCLIVFVINNIVFLLNFKSFSIFLTYLIIVFQFQVSRSR